MQNKDNLIKKYLIIAFAVLAIIGLFLPLVSVSASGEAAGEGAEVGKSVSGIDALNDSIIPIIMIACPIIVIAMDFIKQLEKFRSLIAIIAPAVCLVATIITLIVCMGAATAAGDAAGAIAGAVGASVEMDAGIGIGFIVIIISCIGMFVGGLVKYHGITLDKDGFEKAKGLAKR